MLPHPSHQFINWFYEEAQKNSLVLNPKYQRNPVWSERQRCFLIDSILNAVPIGQIYLNVVTKGRGLRKKTIYEVVDGQQRLRTILDFMRDKLVLTKIPVKAYPVSDLYNRLVGMRYSGLSEELQVRIWNYPIAVQELRQYAGRDIRDMFRRLNFVVERLTKQELRHSQFFGEFAKAVEHLAKNAFWEKGKLFSRRDYQRMRDMEFVSELFIIIIDGIQDQQRTIDEYYVKYDASFPAKSRYMKRFEVLLDRLSHFIPAVQNSRFNKKADFYALFAAMATVTNGRWSGAQRKRAISKLRRLSQALEKPPHKLKGAARQYYYTVIEGPNKLPKREKRTDILIDLLREAFAPR